MDLKMGSTAGLTTRKRFPISHLHNVDYFDTKIENIVFPFSVFEYSFVMAHYKGIFENAKGENIIFKFHIEIIKIMQMRYRKSISCTETCRATHFQGHISIIETSMNILHICLILNLV